MVAALFDYNDYKQYLADALDKRTEAEKGQRSKLAQAMSCQPAYLSQVMKGNAELSPEQAVAANLFLNHGPQEGRFFLNLVLKSRAGTKELRDFYQQELRKLLDERLMIQNRIKANRSLTEEDQIRYYSSWHFAAIHVLVSLSAFRTKQTIAKALNISSRIANEALEFLVGIGILKMEADEYRTGETSLHLNANSPLIQKHHSNWKIRILQSLDQFNERDLHYTSVVSCSHEDLKKVKEIMIQSVQKIRAIIKESKDETVAAYTFDLIGLIQDEAE